MSVLSLRFTVISNIWKSDQKKPLLRAALSCVALSTAAMPWTSASAKNAGFDAPYLCAAVASKVQTPSRLTWVTYLYQDLLADWSEVNESDDARATNVKIANFIDRNMYRSLCDTSNFNPRNGNIIKFSVARQNSNFLDDAVRWGVNLNQVDKADGMTVLDYIKIRRDAAGQAASFGRTMQRYYVKLRAAGAKHANELAPN